MGVPPRLLYIGALREVLFFKKWFFKWKFENQTLKLISLLFRDHWQFWVLLFPSYVLNEFYINLTIVHYDNQGPGVNALSKQKVCIQICSKWRRRVVGNSGSLIWSKTLMELVFNPCGEFQWSPGGPVTQIHSARLLIGAPGIFSDLLRFVQMLKREWGAESNGKLSHLFIPSKTST